MTITLKITRRASLRRAALLALITLFAWTTKAEVVRTGYTAIVAENSGKCLDIYGASADPGTRAIQWHCNFNNNEQWTVQRYNNAFRIVQLQTGQCLAVLDGSKSQGASVVQNPCVGVRSELWSFVPVNNGFRIVSRNSGLCLHVSGDSTDDEANIVQWYCDTSPSSTWIFSSGLITPSSLVDLQASHSGQCLNVNGGSTTAGANIIQWPCVGVANEQWTLEPTGGYYEIVSKKSGQCLNVNGGSTAPGANIVQWPCSASNDLFTLNPVGRAYQLIVRNSGLCVTVGGANQSAGAQVIQSACSPVQNQLWSLSLATLPSSWSSVIPLAVNPIAAANLPNGRLLMWSASDLYTFEGDIGMAASQTYTSVFDPSTKTSTQVVVTNTGDDMFCPGTANLVDGRILVNGGSSSPRTSIYDPATGLWTADAMMNIPRGYQGDTLLSDGSVFTLGGSWSGGGGGKSGEVWTVGGGWRILSGVPSNPIIGPDPKGVWRGDNHLWLFAVSNGRVFHAGPSAQMNWIDTSANGTITSAGARADDPYSMNGNAVLYDVGLILKVGGAPAYQDANATNSAYTININTGVNVTKIAPMAYPRAFSSAVALPNGQVVVAGGQTYPVPFNDNTAVLVPEIWDPATLVFRKLAPMQTPRTYHSTAILLPDGRVFVGGGGQCGTGCAGNHFNTEILTPPYLLNPDGSAAIRPAITSAPATATLGSSFSLTTNAPVVSFALMRLSSVTHTVNNDQRRVPLKIKSTSGTSYSLIVPSDPGTVLPGYYMLFAMNAQGVPSVAATILIMS